MKFLKLFENFDLEVNGHPTKDLNWMKNILDSLNLECSCEINSSEELPFIDCKNDEYRVMIFDSGNHNDFFLVRIYKDGKVIQDFLKSNHYQTIAYDELASEDIVLIVCRYFDKTI